MKVWSPRHERHLTASKSLIWRKTLMTFQSLSLLRTDQSQNKFWRNCHSSNQRYPLSHIRLHLRCSWLLKLKTRVQLKTISLSNNLYSTNFLIMSFFGEKISWKWKIQIKSLMLFSGKSLCPYLYSFLHPFLVIVLFSFFLKNAYLRIHS